MPIRILHVTRFANVVAEDDTGRIWRISPDALEAGVIAATEAEFAALMRDEVENTDLFMTPLVCDAVARLGAPDPGYSFQLVRPGALGGSYDVDNVRIAPTLEILSFSGDIAQQIKDLPEGANVRLNIVD